MIIHVRVKPQAKEDKIIQDKEGLTVYLKAPAHEGKANRALIKLLSKYYKKKCTLKSGAQAKTKLIQIPD